FFFEQLHGEFALSQLCSYDPEISKELIDNFVDSLSTAFLFPLKIPGTKYYDGLKKKEKVSEKIKEMVNDRLGSPQNAVDDDLLGQMIKDMSNVNFVTKEYINKLMFVLMFATFQTVPFVTTLALKFMSENPAVLQELTEEHEEILRKRETLDSSVTWEEFKSMTYTQQVINEALRLGSGTVVKGGEIVQNPIKRFKNVIVSPHGMRGKLTGCCPGDLVKQVYLGSGKVRGSNGIVGLPYNVAQGSGLPAQLRGQNSYVEVTLGCHDKTVQKNDNLHGDFSQPHGSESQATGLGASQGSATSAQSSYLEGYTPVKSLGSTSSSYILIPSPSMRFLPPAILQLPTCLTADSPPLAHLLHSKGSAIPLSTGFVVSKSVPSMRKNYRTLSKDEWPSVLSVSLVDYYGGNNFGQEKPAKGASKPVGRGLSSESKDFEAETRVILDSVAAELHALSWMTVSPAYLDRRSALPFHCDMVLRLRRLLHFADKEVLSGRDVSK
ncbi:mediator of RNA polymerase ii transcription subunit 13, partial [Phtheirospermum japonicum]